MTLDLSKGVKFAVSWLHKRAEEMNDPHAKAILNSAAFSLGQQNASGRVELEATAPSGQAPLEGVKALDWKKTAPDSQFSYAETIFGTIYRVWTHHEANGEWFWNGDGDCHTVRSEGDGKAAAQADYEARIRSALLPASAEPAWWLVVNQHGEAVSAHKVKEAALGHESGLWSGDELVPLYASPPASGAVEAGTPGAPEAFAALDVADRIIERAFGTEVPGDWHEAYRAVAKARNRKSRRALPAAPTEGR